ncbi:MAG TPA: hypothetical protein V6D29_03810 [Leptolyngbyaceae cyanobacterium]
MAKTMTPIYLDSDAITLLMIMQAMLFARAKTQEVAIIEVTDSLIDGVKNTIRKAVVEKQGHLQDIASLNTFLQLMSGERRAETLSDSELIAKWMQQLTGLKLELYTSLPRAYVLVSQCQVALKTQPISSISIKVMRAVKAIQEGVRSLSPLFGVALDFGWLTKEEVDSLPLEVGQAVVAFN